MDEAGCSSKFDEKEKDGKKNLEQESECGLHCIKGKPRNDKKQVM